MDLFRPWACNVQLATHPSEALYDNRSALLERVGALGLTDRFRVEDDQVSLVMDGPRELHVGLTSIQFSSIASDGDDFLTEILRAVEEVIEPSIRDVTVGLQHIVALSLEFDAAVAAARRNLLGELANTVGMTDIALLFDAVHPRSGVDYQAEFGIIRADEAPLRVGGFIGRLGREPSTLAGELIELSYPDVAFFCDSTWKPPLPARMRASEWLPSVVSAVTEYSAEVVRGICSDLYSDRQLGVAQ